MASTRQGYAKAILDRLGAPVTLRTVCGLVCWMVAEGGTAAANPLNTTQPMPGSTPLPGNTAGVQQYVSYQQGLDATVKTLTNGHYGNILNALDNDVPAPTLLLEVEASPWGTQISGGLSTFCNAVYDRWGAEAFKVVAGT